VSFIGEEGVPTTERQYAMCFESALKEYKLHEMLAINERASASGGFVSQTPYRVLSLDPLRSQNP